MRFGQRWQNGEEVGRVRKGPLASGTPRVFVLGGEEDDALSPLMEAQAKP
jgi:hypothetical protein